MCRVYALVMRKPITRVHSMGRSILLLEVQELVLLSSLISNRTGVLSEITTMDSLNLQRLITPIFCLSTRRAVTEQSMIRSRYQEIIETSWLVLLIVALQLHLPHKQENFVTLWLHLFPLLNCCSDNTHQL